MMRVLALMMVVAQITSTVSASHVVWSLPLGDVGGGTGGTSLVDTNGQTVYSIYSINNWASYPVMYLLAIDVTTGATKWNSTLFGSPLTQVEAFHLTQGHTSVYVLATSYKQKVAAVSKVNGAVEWHSTLQHQSIYGAPEAHGVLYFADSRGGLAVNASTGNPITSYQTGFLASGGVPFVISNASTTLVFYPAVYMGCFETNDNGNSGNVTASRVYQVDNGVNHNSLSVLHMSWKGLLMANSTNSLAVLVVADVLTGMTRWQHVEWNTLSLWTWATIVDEDDMVIALFGTELRAFSLSTGHALWKAAMPRHSTGNKPVIVGDDDSHRRYVAVAFSQKTFSSSELAIRLFDTQHGATVDTISVAALNDNAPSYLYAAELRPGKAGMIFASLYYNTQPSNATLYAVSIKSQVPVGLLLLEYSLPGCEGPYHATMLPSGCTSRTGGSTSRVCGPAGSVEVLAFSATGCTGSITSSSNYTEGTCYSSVAGSTIVKSCR